MLRARRMSPAARSRALASLQSSLHSRWHEIYAAPLLQEPQPDLQQPQPHGVTHASSGGVVSGTGGEEGGHGASGAVVRSARGEVRADVVRCGWGLAALAAELDPDGGSEEGERSASQFMMLLWHRTSLSFGRVGPGSTGSGAGPGRRE